MVTSPDICAVSEEDVEETIVVVVEHCDASRHGFRRVTLRQPPSLGDDLAERGRHRLPLARRQRSHAAPGAAARDSARCNRLHLVNQALWTLLKQKTGLTDAQLQKEIERLDQAEAKPASASTALVCKDCKKTVSRRHKVCIYCGGADLMEPPGASPIG